MCVCADVHQTFEKRPEANPRPNKVQNKVTASLTTTTMHQKHTFQNCTNCLKDNQPSSLLDHINYRAHTHKENYKLIKWDQLLLKKRKTFADVSERLIPNISLCPEKVLVVMRSFFVFFCRSQGGQSHETRAVWDSDGLEILRKPDGLRPLLPVWGGELRDRYDLWPGWPRPSSADRQQQDVMKTQKYRSRRVSARIQNSWTSL